MSDFNNDDFDPNANYEDAEFLEHAKKTVKAAQYLQQQDARQYQDKVMGDLWAKALDEEGIDPAAYEHLAAQDPQLVQEVVGESMKNLVQRVKRGRDPQTGRFVKQSHTEAAPGVQQRHPDQQAKLDALKEKSKTGPLTPADEEAVIDAMIGKLF